MARTRRKIVLVAGIAGAGLVLAAVLRKRAASR